MSGRVVGRAAISPGSVKGALCVKRACQSQRGLPWVMELVGCPGGGVVRLFCPAQQVSREPQSPPHLRAFTYAKKGVLP